ncbi:MAG TPA: c-type cytochrome [Gemmatimonadaceae bacterium]|jgi:cytochrome c oxidase cbb3-type subunit 3|nr:c-type cytochrome [Gemmatimonadaceae bacterium]
MSLRTSHALFACALLIAACEREDRRLDSTPPSQPTAGFVSPVRLQPGPMIIEDSTDGPFDHNAAGTSEGQVLFEQMNCSGCHANGGGGMGPALMDDEWLYGSTPDQIFASIAEGRPNGMPSWKNKLTTKQIWELVAYVRSLSGLTPKGARPNREDHMMVKPAPSQTPNAKPHNSGKP